MRIGWAGWHGVNGFGEGVLGGINVGVDGGVMGVHGCSIVHSGVTWGVDSLFLEGKLCRGRQWFWHTSMIRVRGDVQGRGNSAFT